MRLLRLFLGVPIEGQLREAARELLAGLGQRFPSISWIAPENLHVTMRFFGDVPENGIPEVVSWVSPIAAAHPLGNLGFGKTGIFPQRHGLTLWVGVEPGDGIVELGRALGQNSPYGMPDRRLFKAHVTMGRYRKRSGDAPASSRLLEHFNASRLPRVVQDRSRLVLFSSQLTPDGANYTELRSW